MKIIVDAMGGDNAPLEILKACEKAADKLNLEIILTGDEKKIKQVAVENKISLENMQIVDCTQIITMEDKPSSIVREKKDSSMAIGLKLLKENKADGFISAGNSGALIYGATFITKRIKNIKRPAFAPVMPKENGKFMLIDCGANLECRAEILAQFGVMGSIYMNKVENIKNPTVALANVGTEAEKGTENLKEAYNLLKSSKLNFIGNVEARDIPKDGADVIVTDGFTGNMMLKMYEGVAKVLIKKIKSVFLTNLKTKLAAALVLPQMKKLKKELDYKEYGGSAILGTAKPVFKAHGNSDAKAFFSAINLLVKYANSNVIEEISKACEKTDE